MGKIFVEMYGEEGQSNYYETTRAEYEEYVEECGSGNIRIICEEEFIECGGGKWRKPAWIDEA